MKKYILFIVSIVVPFLLKAQCEDNGNYWNQSWVSCEKSMNPNPIRGNTYWLLYEFHAPQPITTFHIWNANRPGESGQGARDVIIDYSVDGDTWEALGGFSFLKADESENYEGFEGPSFDGQFVKKVLISILNAHDNGDCVSIAELKFGLDPDACYGVIDECGICDGPGEQTWYLDADEDGLGDANNSMDDCNQPIGYVANNSDLCDNGAFGWGDISPLFADNGCNGCHDGGAAGGLDLRTYETTMMGGDICGTNLFTGSSFVEIITTSGYDGCGTAIGIPSMNDRASGEFDAEELAKLQKWIDGGAPNDCAEFIFIIDNDEDGFADDVDCDDTNPDINPDAEEIPNNGIDEDCDGSDLTTSTHQLSNAIFQIYPNPVKDIINIEVTGQLKYQSVIFTVDGKELMRATNETILHVESLTSGTYLLEIIDLDTKQKIVKKIVKAN